MTAAIIVGIDAKGGAQAEAEAKRVAHGVDTIAASEHKAAAAAKARGAAQQAANKHGGGPHGHGSLVRNLHLAGAAGGEAGHLGHFAARAARFGAAGIGAAVAGQTINALLQAAHEYGEGMGKVLEQTQEITRKVRDAKRGAEDAAFSFGQSNSLGIHRALTAGASMDGIAGAQNAGINADSYGKLFGMKDGQNGFDIAKASRAFGLDPNQAIEMMSKRGMGKGDSFELAAQLAGRAQDRIITSDEIARARSGQGADGINSIDDASGELSAIKVRGIASGGAERSGRRQLEKAENPGGAALSEAIQEGNDKCAVLQKIADNTNRAADFFQEFMHTAGFGEMGAQHKANDELEHLRAALAATGD